MWKAVVVDGYRFQFESRATQKWTGKSGKKANTFLNSFISSTIRCWMCSMVTYSSWDWLKFHWNLWNQFGFCWRASIVWRLCNQNFQQHLSVHFVITDNIIMIKFQVKLKMHKNPCRSKAGRITIQVYLVTNLQPSSYFYFFFSDALRFILHVWLV